MEPRKQFKDVVKTKPITRIRNVEIKDLDEDKCPKCKSDNFEATTASFNNVAKCDDCGNKFIVDIFLGLLSKEQEDIIRDNIK